MSSLLSPLNKHKSTTINNSGNVRCSLQADSFRDVHDLQCALHWITPSCKSSLSSASAQSSAHHPVLYDQVMTTARSCCLLVLGLTSTAFCFLQQCSKNKDNRLKDYYLTMAGARGKTLKLVLKSQNNEATNQIQTESRAATNKHLQQLETIM